MAPVTLNLVCVLRQLPCFSLTFGILLVAVGYISRRMGLCLATKHVIQRNYVDWGRWRSRLSPSAHVVWDIHQHRFSCNGRFFFIPFTCGKVTAMLAVAAFALLFRCASLCVALRCFCVEVPYVRHLLACVRISRPPCNFCEAFSPVLRCWIVLSDWFVSFHFIRSSGQMFHSAYFTTLCKKFIDSVISFVWKGELNFDPK